MTQDEKRTTAKMTKHCSSGKELIMLCPDWDTMQESFRYATKVCENIRVKSEIIKEECAIRFETGGRIEFITPGMMCVCEGCDGCIQRDQEKEIHEAIDDAFDKYKNEENK